MVWIKKIKYFTHVEPQLEQIEEWAKDGLSEKQIANNLGIAYSTFREYKNKYSALSALLKKGRDSAIERVENALFKKALGYEYEEVTKELVENTETGKKELVVVKSVRKVVHPDAGSIIFILKNKRPEVWKDNPHKVKFDKEILELRKKAFEKEEW